jgi:hypothetical protein
VVTRKALVPLSIAVLACAAPAAASAAGIATDRPCYAEHRTVSLTGTGFAPSTRYDVTLDGRPFGSGTTDATGALAGTFAPPELAHGVDTYTLAVTDGTAGATTTFSQTRFKAGFSPSAGDPKTLMVRFKAYGFGLLAPNRDVYLHYVRPDGTPKRTIRLGTAQGPCGTIARTRLRRLFPFDAERGNWRLQFDTRRRYTRGSKDSPFLFYAVGVRVRRV